MSGSLATSLDNIDGQNKGPFAALFTGGGSPAMDYHPIRGGGGGE